MENSSRPPLTEAQKCEITSLLKLGCDRQTAAHQIGCCMTQLSAAIVEDPLFATEVFRAEATAEFIHMRNVRLAANDEKNWRVSVWWLERRAPDRYGRRDADSITPRQMQRILALLAEIIGEEVYDAEDRQRLLDRLRCFVATLPQVLGEPWWETGSTGDEPELPVTEVIDDSTEEGEL